MAAEGIGAAVLRKEDRRFLTGAGTYTDDVKRPNETYMQIVRSPHAHARIVRVDSAQALRRPGVVHVLVPSDVAALGRLPLLVPH